MQRKLAVRLSMAALVLLLLITALTASGRDRGQFMFLDELQPGMQGICKTVIRGNQITTFNFRIVDIVTTQYVGWSPRNLAYKSVILARAGEGIEEAGGIASGMSGSPCYIHDKLIGALFASPVWETTLNEPELSFLIQPIEDMLPVLDACLQKTAPVGTAAGFLSYLPSEDQTIMASSLTGATDIERIRFVNRSPSLDELEAHPRTLFVHFLSTPVAVAGLSERAFNWLKDGIDIDIKGNALRYLRGEDTFNNFVRALSMGLEERYDVQLRNLGGYGQLQEVDPGPLQPGAPIGAALMLGDISYGGIGTITYIEDQCLIAFGHPAYLLGDTDLFMTSAYVMDTIRTINGPYKKGNLVEEIGGIVEDRPPAIAGALGRSAGAIRFNIEVTDKDSGITNEFQAKSVALSSQSSDNLLITGLEALDRTLGRIGQGTLVLDMTINGAGMPKPLQRHDIFVSDSDISGEAMLDPSWIDYLLAWNEFTDPQVSSIDLRMTVEKTLKIKVIEGVEPGQQSVNAGGRLRYTVTLQTYRGQQETVSGYINIPQYASGDYIRLEAFPARDFFWRYEMYGPWARPYWMEQITSLEGLIQAIEDVPTNGLLVVTAYSLTQGGRSAVYAYDLKPLGDWYVDGDRTSEDYVQVQ